MNDEDLINTLQVASKSAGDNIAMSMLLIIAADRIKELNDEQEENNLQSH